MTIDVDIDRKLWDEIITGNETSFRQLYDKYVGHLLHFGRQYCQDISLIEDCIQDLFVDLFYYRARLSRTDNVRYYLYRSLRRKLAKAVKGAKNFQHTDDDTGYAFFIEYSIEDTIVDTEQKKELATLVKNELESLPSKQQEALYLRFFQSMSYDEIAELMQIEKQSIRMSVYRAIKTIRENICKKLPNKTASLLLVLPYIRIQQFEKN
ncbi:sigma-70 family RNA polymerase sigma factor [Puteibacter caeruleilacunae]|nr:sigma-70 family RNA polymerase sigma factor [Puteibacter caeruleilacunae]